MEKKTCEEKKRFFCSVAEEPLVEHIFSFHIFSPTDRVKTTRLYGILKILSPRPGDANSVCDGFPKYLFILQARQNVNSLYPGLSTASLTQAVVNTGKDRH